MQIKKINNNKLKVILSLSDLDKKNIDVDSFLSNSIESQDLFFEILDLAEEEYNFDIEDNKAVVEAISLDNNIFILTITKLKNEYLNTYTGSQKIYYFENTEDLFNLCSLIKRHHLSLNNINVFNLSNKYYLILNSPNSFVEKVLPEYSNLLNSSDFFEDILAEYGKKINIG